MTRVRGQRPSVSASSGHGVEPDARPEAPMDVAFLALLALTAVTLPLLVFAVVPGLLLATLARTSD